jgi:hypothetical protein
VFSKELGDPGATEFDHPSRTYRGDGRYRGPTLHRSRLIRYPDAPRNRSEEASPLRDGVLALAFHTLLSFQGTSPGCSSATHLRFPCQSPPERRGRYHGPFKIVKDFPPARSAYSRWSTTCHVDTFTQKRRPAPRPTGRQDGHRTAVGSNPLGARRPPVFRCRRHWRRPERSSVSKNFPACSLEKVAPGSTACQLGATGWRPAITTVPAVSVGATAGAGPVFPATHDPGASSATRRRLRTRAPGGGPGPGGRRSAGARPAPPGARSGRWSRPAGRRAGPHPG